MFKIKTGLPPAVSFQINKRLAMSLFSTNRCRCQLFLKLFLDPFATDESGGNFMFGQRQAFGHVGQRRFIHESGHIISRVEENAAKPTDRFLRATGVARHGNAVNRR